MRLTSFVLAMALSPACFAQHGHHGHQASGYAGLQSREIKALSAEQMADLKEGRGMGASLAAELNGVPGPLHVLELKEKLHVSQQQLTVLEGIMSHMKAQARDLGARLVTEEAALDRAFASGSADEQLIRSSTARIADLQGQLRAVHLLAHLKTRQLLSAEQVRAYNLARGYAPHERPPLH